MHPVEDGIIEGESYQGLPVSGICQSPQVSQSQVSPPCHPAQGKARLLIIRPARIRKEIIRMGIIRERIIMGAIIRPEIMRKLSIRRAIMSKTIMSKETMSLLTKRGRGAGLFWVARVYYPKELQKFS